MRFPSTNTDGRNPSVGGVVSNVESSHGVLLDGGSTGGIVTAVGDDANISITVRGKGTGSVFLGNSSQFVVLGAPGGSGIKLINAVNSTWSHAAISSGQFGEIVVASTTADIMPGDLFCVAAGVVAPTAVAGIRVSTAATSRLTIMLTCPGSTATSTISGTATITWIDLT